ncbi:MAG: Flp pilus assembly protein CpaB [Alphaproteobacteria bacterium]|nr:Flp pilus assembly protein CpaB [Alphaproteobacteria bacterium]
MTLRTVILLVLALVSAVSTAFYARNWLNSERAAMLANVPAEAVPAAPATLVLVAAENLAAGNFVKAEDLKWQAWPEEGVIDSYSVKGKRDMNDFVGAVVRASVSSGEPLTDARIVHPGDRGFLAAVLEPGKRAVSVPVNATSGIAGFVFPGDWVDVILTVKFRTETEKGKTKERYFSETLLNDIRVLAIDQTLENAEGEVSVAKTATLEVAPKQAEKIAIALEMGVLSLSLHSIAREQDHFSQVARDIGADPTETAPKKSYTMDNDVYYMRDKMGGGTTRKKKQIHVLRGSEATTAAF